MLGIQNVMPRCALFCVFLCVWCVCCVCCVLCVCGNSEERAQTADAHIIDRELCTHGAHDGLIPLVVHNQIALAITELNSKLFFDVMSRISKAVAMDLIAFAKTIQVKANFWDPKAVSAFEFARQMSSPNLKKKNPSFECNLTYLESADPPSLQAGFSDGSTWAIDTAGFKASELREAFYSKCARIEDKTEMAGGETTIPKKE